MTDDPNSLFSIFCGLEFLDKEVKHAGDIRVRGVNIVEEVTPIPEVGVQRNDAETILILDGVGPIMKSRLIRGRGVDPPVMLPKPRNMVVVPALLLPKRSGQTMRRVDSLIKMSKSAYTLLVNSRITEYIQSVAKKKKSLLLLGHISRITLGF